MANPKEQPSLNDTLTGHIPGLSAVARATIRRQSSPEAQSISTEVGLAAALQIAEVAQQQGVAYALAGGIAMHLYGFTRATTEADVIASALLDLQTTRDLSFGGETYPAQVGERVINVDWIVRNDEVADFYQAALSAAAPSEIGLPMLSCC